MLSIIEESLHGKIPVRISTIAKRTGNSFRTQTDAVQGLIDLGMVEQKTVIRNNSKVFIVTEKGQRFVDSCRKMRNMIEIGPGLKN